MSRVHTVGQLLDQLEKLPRNARVEFLYDPPRGQPVILRFAGAEYELGNRFTERRIATIWLQR